MDPFTKSRTTTMQRKHLITIASLLVAVSGFAAAIPAQIGIASSMEISLKEDGLGFISRDNSGGNMPINITAVDHIGTDGELRRYRVSLIAIQSGTHDLRDYLKLPKAMNKQMLSPMLVEVAQPLPTTVPGRLEPRPGGVANLATLPSSIGKGLAAIWGVALIVIVAGFWRRLRASRVSVPAVLSEDGFQKRVTLAELNLLTSQGFAELERRLVHQWIAELQITEKSPVDAFRALQSHPKGRALLDALAEWQRGLETGPCPAPLLLKDYAVLDSERKDER